MACEWAGWAFWFWLEEKTGDGGHVVAPLGENKKPRGCLSHMRSSWPLLRAEGLVEMH